MRFKLVYCQDVSTYTIWVTNDQGNWECKDAMNVFTNEGKRVEGKSDNWGMVSERLLWLMDYYHTLGYRFIGIFNLEEEEL